MSNRTRNFGITAAVSIALSQNPAAAMQVGEQGYAIPSGGVASIGVGTCFIRAVSFSDAMFFDEVIVSYCWMVGPSGSDYNVGYPSPVEAVFDDETFTIVGATGESYAHVALSGEYCPTDDYFLENGESHARFHEGGSELFSGYGQYIDAYLACSS